MDNMTVDKWDIASLIERGGIYYGIPGTTPKELLAGVIDLLPPIPSLNPKKLYKEILEREALMPTSIGKGIAIPHPKQPMLKEGDIPLIAVIFPVLPMGWHSPDGSKVHTAFLIVSSSTKQHLNALSKINFLCQQEKFHSLITERAPKEEIITAIREAEASWAGAS